VLVCTSHLSHACCMDRPIESFQVRSSEYYLSENTFYLCSFLHKHKIMFSYILNFILSVCRIWGFWQRWLWRIPSSGLWRHVDLAWTDVSEERIASIFRVEKSVSEEPAWVGGNRLHGFISQKTVFFILSVETEGGFFNWMMASVARI
jgi:hypothetical protein